MISDPDHPTGYQQRVMDWFEAMHRAYEGFSDEQRAEFHAWEKSNIDGHSVATSDWPGWEPLIGPPPMRETGQPASAIASTQED